MKKEDFSIIRSKRKTIALVVGNDAKLVIRAPFSVKDEEITALLKKRQVWIAEKIKQVSTFSVNHPPIEIKDGHSAMYLGNTYTISKDSTTTIKVAEPFIYVPENTTLAGFAKWLKEESFIILTERVKRYSKLMGVDYSKLSLSDAIARWGSCSTKNSLNFAWRLIMCPIAVIDYVVVHELSHITYKNHSKIFWARVKTILPDYKEQQDWLKLNKKIMEII